MLLIQDVFVNRSIDEGGSCRINVYHGGLSMRLRAAEIFLLRIPIETPVKTSFGIMYDRPSLVIRLEDTDGCAGWGEVWCNFPSVGAEHRVRLLETLLLPALSNVPHELESWNPWRELTKQFSVVMLQSGEYGPFAQCVAAIDSAIWDLKARRKGLPLFRLLSGFSEGRVRIYASGINPNEIDAKVTEAIENGFTACKIKAGFDLDEDIGNVFRARDILGMERSLMVDVNQGWDMRNSLKFLAATSDADLAWLEEPLRHDASDAEWRHVSAATRTRLAAGENFASFADFQNANHIRGIQVLQPDLGKWGGISGMVEVASLAAVEDLLFCPHWLGGGIGLLASLHVKAADLSQNGCVEVDINANASRSSVLDGTGIKLSGDSLNLPTDPGIGPVEEGIRHLQTFSSGDRRRVSFL